MDTPTSNQTTDTTKAERYIPKAGEWGYKSPAEIEELKRKWYLNPREYIEEAFGFEAYYDELKAFREVVTKAWRAEETYERAKAELAAKLAAPFVVGKSPAGRVAAMATSQIAVIYPYIETGMLDVWGSGDCDTADNIEVHGEYAKALWKKLTGTEWPTPPENKPEPTDLIESPALD